MMVFVQPISGYVAVKSPSGQQQQRSIRSGTFDSGEFSDVTLEVVGDDGVITRFPVHKSVLSMRSSVFAKMFSRGPTQVVCVDFTIALI